MQEGSKETEQSSSEDDSVLTISPEKVCFVIQKAREFDVKDAVTEPDPGSNPSDDMMASCSKIIATTRSSKSLPR